MNNEDEFATRPLKDPMNRLKPGAHDQAPSDPSDPTARYLPSTAKVGDADAQGIEKTKALGNDEVAAVDVPKKVGRYVIKALLGRGGFGEVYLGFDEQLKREVAVKLTFGSKVGSDSVKMFLAEAQMLAELDHPNIVPVYDIGTTSRGDIFIVSKFIDGTDLAQRIQQNRPNRESSLEIIASIADALHYAHTKGMIHRDIKPANILLDRLDRPYLADFGIAMRETDQTGAGEITGTPAYMSPEQARGEGHLVTNQSDIFSLGVVLYELLSGRRPFRAKTAQELLRMVQRDEILTPKNFDSTISRELERICLKALARQPSDRFRSASELAEEVRHVLSNPSLLDSISRLERLTNTPNSTGAKFGAIETASRSVDKDLPSQSTIAIQIQPMIEKEQIRVIPKGLRSFDQKDSEFFIELLPGPFDRNGLPEGLRFWKNRIEALELEESFRVGLVYGPSGCGKSSLMRAGLLPRLSPKIEAIYIEATPDGTADRLLREIQKKIPGMVFTNLAEALSIIRRRKLVPSGGKLLLVIDQFEQWLYQHKRYAGTELTNALRQCDGVTVQAIVMVRDDFWLSVSRFLKEIDIPILERENSAMVDLFDRHHATKVLGLFGRAYGRLPENAQDWTDEHVQFLEQAVDGLCQDDKVISVRLALFAEMLKSKSWIPKTLADLGGISGVGVTFLEETFGQKHAPIQIRHHLKGIRALLGALLPEFGANIKGHSRGLVELQKIVGYENRSEDFSELISLLDKNLRLITPTDVTELNGDRLCSYQLAHDYLVPSLRDWLTQKQRETKRGRAELKLAERAVTWNLNKENKQLPTILEWVQILRWTEKHRWTSSEQSLMKTAGRVHLRNASMFVISTILISGLVGYMFQQQSLRSQREKINVALDSLQRTSGPAVSVTIEKLQEMKQPLVVLKDLKSRYAEASGALEKLSLAVALAHFGWLDADYLVSQIDLIEDRDLGNLVSALSKDPIKGLDALRSAADDCKTPDLQHRKARLALAALGLGDTTLPIDAVEFEGETDHGVRSWFIDEFPRWEFNIGDLIKTVYEAQSPALRSAVCLGVGRMPLTRVSMVDRNRVTEFLQRWYLLPDSSTHSAVAWLQRQWEIPTDSLPNTAQQTRDRDWYMNSQGVTFVRIKPRVGGDVSPALMPYWLANREVTRGEFEAFINDPDYSGQKPSEPLESSRAESVSPTLGHPAVNVSWYHALMYCNWLSIQEGRKPFYRILGKEKNADDEPLEEDLDTWEIDSSSDGYRLPSEAEWKYACSAGTLTDWSHGSDESLLGAYWQMYPSKTPSVCGNKLPNAWGLHDMHGNVLEWCWDIYGQRSQRRVYKGGSWALKALACRADHQDGANASNRTSSQGLRLALNSPSDPLTPKSLE